MSGTSESADDKTEAATPRHLEKAREQGNVPMSREVAGFASLLAAAVALYYAGPAAVRTLARTAVLFLANSDQSVLAGPAGLRLAAEGWARATLPVLGAALVAGVAAVLVQTNMLLHLGAIAPKFSRVNPASGLKRVFGTDGVVELVKSLKPGGRLVFVEFRLEDNRVPILTVHRMSEKQVIKEMEPHPVRHARTLSHLPWQHVIIFEKVDEKKTPTP